MQYANKFTVLQYMTLCTVWKARNLHLKFPSSVLTALPVASTQWCASQTGLLALAILDATLLAFAGDKLPADLGCLEEHCPERFVHAAGLDPTPVGW